VLLSQSIFVRWCLANGLACRHMSLAPGRRNGPKMGVGAGSEEGVDRRVGWGIKIGGAG
jgi:hypothetical protein